VIQIPPPGEETKIYFTDQLKPVPTSPPAAIALTVDGNTKQPRKVVNGVISFNASPETFRRGDVDSNGKLELTDVIRFLNFQFVGTVESLECMDAADVDDNGQLDLTDAIRILNFLYTGTAGPPEPPGHLQCGSDSTPDGLDPCQYPPGSCL